MDSTLILWLWPVVVLGSLALFGIIVTRRDDRNADHRHHTPAE